MRDDFGVEVEAVKAALTSEQVRKFGLPPRMTAKQGSSRRAGFVEEHGEHVWELEAISTQPARLQKIVRECILGVLDVEAFNSEQQAEAADARHLHVLRETVHVTLRDAIDDWGAA